MADLIRLKGGSGTVPTLQDREIAFSKDEKSLYIGTNDKNVKVGDEAWEKRIKALEDIAATINSRLDALENPSE